MLTKEYRISLPMSVEEYRIAQLYMIQKKSRDESHGTDSGVEIIENRPYTHGPGGCGQYTYKIYHIGSHLPGWFKAILPKSALRVEEEAWNAYPYTKTTYRCPFIEKFFLEVETEYHNDPGSNDHIFSLSAGERAQTDVDYIDIVKDSLSGEDYKKEEDPRLYKSKKTGRGPLSEEWRAEYAGCWRDGHFGGKEMMTAYKLCRVEFKYWGMQNKIERFIHDVALRKMMLRAHRQAWCWQDEYHGLTLEDIRNLERETQIALAAKMAVAEEEERSEVAVDASASEGTASCCHGGTKKTDDHQLCYPNSENPRSGVYSPESSFCDSSSQVFCDGRLDFKSGRVSQEWADRTALRSNSGVVLSPHRPSYRNMSSSSEDHWNSLEELQESSSDEEYFDAQEDVHQTGFQASHPVLVSSSSLDLMCGTANSNESGGAGDEPQFDKKVEQFRQMYGQDSSSASVDTSPHQSSSPCPTKILFLVIHGGSVLDSNEDAFCRHRDLTSLQTTFEGVIQSHYQSAQSHVQLRLVACPNLCKETLSLLSSLSQYSCFSGSGSMDMNLLRSQNFVPLGVIPLLATGSSEYQAHVNATVASANQAYNDFLKSESGIGFSGQVCLLSDAIGSLLAYDALTAPGSPVTQNGSRYGSLESLEMEGSTVAAEVADNLSSVDKHVQELGPTRAVVQNKPSSLGKNTDGSSDVVLADGSEVYSPSEERLTAAAQGTLAKQQMKRSSGHSDTPAETREESEVRRTSSGSQSSSCVARFDFDVSDFFMCGAPLGMVLAFRKLQRGGDAHLARPACHQVYNLFHSHDPTASRIEPLLHDGFSVISPVNISRYSRFPLGDGEPVHVVETVQKHLKIFTTDKRDQKGPLVENPRLLHRQCSLSSMTSTSSTLGESTVSCITSVTKNWWGVKRVDYVLYCPEALHSFPTNALPHLFHSSFWESTDLVAFILRQVLKHRDVVSESGRGIARASSFKIKTPREKWLKRRTTIKVRNLQPNHRANDVVVLEGMPQHLTARFMYGSLDITSLTGEKVDVNVMKQPPTGEWTHLGTKITESHGRFTFTIPEEDRLSQGIYPVKLMVRGDHTSADFFLAVLPRKTEAVVFSIDGSFTASVSITGKDPKVRAGAVDVVRHWQDFGYLILYVSARPDLQHRKVVTWLAQHNFPHGLVAFMDGLSKDPLKQKYNYIKLLQTEAQIELKAAYGSSKDISIYRELGLQPQQIFIVGKTSRKQHSQAQILSDGYSAHLTQLNTSGFTRPAVGNARMFLRKSNFRLSTQEQHPRDGKKVLRRAATLDSGLE